MQRKFQILTALVVLLITVVCMQTSVFASGMGFSIDPVWPENQASDNGYFDLQVQPGQQQDISVNISNVSDEDIVVSVEVVTASTNRNGIADYTSSENVDETLAYNFADIATVHEPSISIPAGGSAVAVITLNFPDEEFDGALVGGVNLLKEITQSERDSGNMILNQFSFVVALRAFQNENPVAPSFALGEVGSELVDYRASYVAYIRNTVPLLAKNVGVYAQIYARGGDEPLATYQNDNVEFAPNSMFPLYMVDDEGRGIVAGDYTARVQLSYEGQNWEFEEDFTVAAETAANVNANALNQNEGQTAGGTQGGLPSWALIALIAGGAVLVLVIVIVIVMVNRMKKMNKMAEAYMAKIMEGSAPTDDGKSAQ